MEREKFTVITIPPLDEAGRDEVRRSAGLRGFVGRKPFTDVSTPPNFGHATDEYIAYDPAVDGAQNAPQPPAGGTGRRRAGVIGDIASSSAMSKVGTQVPKR